MKLQELLWSQTSTISQCVSHTSPHTGWQDYQDGVKRIPTACITIEDAELMWRMAQRGQRIVVRLTMGAKTLPDADSFNTVAEIKGWQHPEQVKTHTHVTDTYLSDSFACLSWHLYFELPKWQGNPICVGWPKELYWKQMSFPLLLCSSLTLN